MRRIQFNEQYGRPMRSVNLGFMGTTIHYGGSDGGVYATSDIAALIDEHNYPKETQWGLVTLLATVVNHANSGVDITAHNYKAGAQNTYLTIMATASDIVKDKAIASLSGSSSEKLDSDEFQKVTEQWSRSLFKTLAESHKGQGVDVADRAYKVGLFNTFNDIAELQQDRLTQDKPIGAAPNADI